MQQGRLLPPGSAGGRRAVPEPPGAERGRKRSVPVGEDPVRPRPAVRPPAGLPVLLQVEHDFILQAERETFIEQMKDVMDKAEDMLSEDADVDRGSDPGASPPRLGTCGPGTGEVRPGQRSWEGHAALGEVAGGECSQLGETRPGPGGSVGVRRPCRAPREAPAPRGLLISDPSPPRRAASPRPTPRCISRMVRVPPGLPPPSRPTSGRGISVLAPSVRRALDKMALSGSHGGFAGARGEHPAGAGVADLSCVWPWGHGAWHGLLAASPRPAFWERSPLRASCEPQAFSVEPPAWAAHAPRWCEKGSPAPLRACLVPAARGPVSRGRSPLVSPAVLSCPVVLHTGKRWFIICPVAEHPAAAAPEPSPPLPLSSVQPDASQGRSTCRFPALLPGNLVAWCAGSARTVARSPACPAQHRTSSSFPPGQGGTPARAVFSVLVQAAPWPRSCGLGAPPILPRRCGRRVPLLLPSGGPPAGTLASLLR